MSTHSSIEGEKLCFRQSSLLMMLLFPFLTDTENWEECVEDIFEDFESTKANTDESPTVPDDLHEPSTERNQGSTIVLWLLHFLVALQKKNMQFQVLW